MKALTELTGRRKTIIHMAKAIYDGRLHWGANPEVVRRALANHFGFSRAEVEDCYEEAIGALRAHLAKEQSHDL
jgi:hypothetical protein